MRIRPLAVNLIPVYRIRGYDAVQLASALEVNTRYHAASLAGITTACATEGI